ncbi:major facilitator transporter [Hyaloraphidium curvatum]|nr:major facilitator transporter [Hyaloraphidium curvatum]
MKKAQGDVPPGGGSGTAFALLWASQLVSLLASDIANFALRVHTYQATGSVSQFALITLFSELPSLLLAPLAGVVVDRYDRKRLMVLADVGSALVNLGQFYVFLHHGLTLPVVYVANALGSVLNAFQWPAFTATVSLLAPPGQIGRYAGLNQVGPALSMLFAPLAAGALVSYDPSLRTVFLLEFGSCAAAVLVTSLAALPSPPAHGSDQSPSVLRDIREHYDFIRERPGLAALLAYLLLGQFTSGVVQVLMTPLVLSFSSPTILGSVLTVSGTGAMFGSGLVTLWGGPKRRVFAVLAIFSLQGLTLALIGVYPNTTWVLSLAFFYMFFLPMMRANREAIWQAKTPLDMQGRIFSTQRMVGQFALPMASIIAGPLADRVFEPMLAPKGGLASYLGPLLGTGKGRGVALLFVILGLGNAALGLAGLMYAPLRRVDVDLPDVAAPAADRKKDK